MSRDGSIAAQGLLTSLTFCAACGHRLSLTGSTAKNGERIANYFCRTHHAGSGDCFEPAVASTRTLDPYVEGLLLEALADPTSKLVKAHEVGARIAETAELRSKPRQSSTRSSRQRAGVCAWARPETAREVERAQDASHGLREFDDASAQTNSVKRSRSRRTCSRQIGRR